MSDRLERIRNNAQETQQEVETQERFIVAEVSKNWPEEPLDGQPRYLAQRFEKVINDNWQRGYRLVDWKFSRLLSQSQNHVNETIVAVFEQFERGFKS